MPEVDTGKAQMHSRYLVVSVCLVLAVVTLAVHWQLTNHEFVVLDDNAYVGLNSHVQTGLTGEGIKWAFTTFEANFWHPLTWLSHMLDCQLFGLKAGMHHLTSLLFHVVNTVLLFLILRRMSGALWRSAFVAALFALHPLHVESVAWISERKDVISTFFWMLTIWAYARYTERPGVNRYLLVLLFFTLGLLAKPMLVTLPFVLLMMDYWPLGRWQIGLTGKETRSMPRESSLFRLIYEKIPLLGVMAIFIVVAFLAQGDAIQPLDEFPLKARIANALVSYVTYIRKMFWPNELAVFYPYPQTLPLWQVAGSGILLVLLSIVSIRMVRRRPYLTVGWFWYLGTLMPVIGLVQVGTHAMADRYTYIPLIGLFLIIAWGIPDLLRKWPHRKIGFAILAGLLLSVFAICAWFQARHWKDSVSLFTHAVDVTTDNWLARNNLGFSLVQQGRNNEAITHFSEALRIKPNYWEGHVNLGNTLALAGKFEEAIDHFYDALDLKPDDPEAHKNLGIVLAIKGHLDEAVIHLNEALRLTPEDPEVHFNLGVARYRQGEFITAIKHFREVLRMRPGDAQAQKNLESAMARIKRKNQ